MSIGGSHRPSNYPYLGPSEGSNEIIATPGGIIFRGYAYTQPLLIGDAVYVAGGACAFDKSLTLSNYNSRIGIVVGGSVTSYAVRQTNTSSGYGPDAIDAVAGQPATITGKPVLVMTHGICYAQVDGACTIGQRLTASASLLGFVSPTGAVPGNIIGIALDASPSPSAIRMFVALS